MDFRGTQTLGPLTGKFLLSQLEFDNNNGLTCIILSIVIIMQ